MNKKQREIIERLKHSCETFLEASNKALSENATEHDVNIALYMAHVLGIE